jgi:hypothetical protein
MGRTGIGVWIWGLLGGLRWTGALVGGTAITGVRGS